VAEQTPKVSVIIATYNMAQFLGDAIASVLAQTVPDLEVVIVDDGSKDNTAEVIAKFASDPRVHYHKQANSGQTKAKNVGVRHSRGTYIAFCDADDLWLPDKLERQLPLFDAEGKVGVVYSRNRRILTEGEHAPEADENVYYSGEVTPQLFYFNFISFGTAIVRRRCIDEFGAFDEQFRMGIDWDLWLRISTRYQIRFLDAVTYLYRVWPGQMSTNWRGRYDHAFRIMEKFLREYPGRIEPAFLREAYAHTYTERARLRALLDGDFRGALSDIGTALRYKISYLPAWKSIGRVCVNVATGPAGSRSPTT
jgi:glycosyltransferase involved in cell wall biosynthesis